MRRVPGIKHSEVVGASFGHILIQIGVALLIVLVGCGDTPTSPSQLNTPEDSPPSTPESEGPARVAAVSVTPSSAAFGLGLTVRLTATVYDSVGHSLSDRTINWTSSDQGIATVDEMGAVTGVAVGSAIISALCEDHKAEAVITVRRVSVTSIVSYLIVLGISSSLIVSHAALPMRPRRCPCLGGMVPAEHVRRVPVRRERGAGSGRAGGISHARLGLGRARRRPALHDGHRGPPHGR